MWRILDRLNDLFLVPDEGHITLAVARHAAERWPSPEVAEYAAQRSRLLHKLVDDLDIAVASWGETDGAYPREVVQVILDISQIAIPSLASVVAAWITVRPRKPREDAGQQHETDSVPGWVIIRPDGARLELTYRSELSKKEQLRLIALFLKDGD
ncbi:hypothetical protein J5X84_03990 [Streptosporangiaceae bacterium NEAU-GS5]|nr:hypothetical protein [Streptosporangiaceae bacterium NEAU-GS5]